MSIIGERIKEIRKIKGLTQKEFSSLICVSASYLSRVETGVEIPTDMLIKLISLEFNVSVEWLHGKTDDICDFRTDRFNRGPSDFDISRNDTLTFLNNQLNKINSSQIDDELELIFSGFLTTLNLNKTNLTSKETLILFAFTDFIYDMFDVIEDFEKLDTQDTQDTQGQFEKRLKMIKRDTLSSANYFFDELKDLYIATNTNNIEGAEITLQKEIEVVETTPQKEIFIAARSSNHEPPKKITLSDKDYKTLGEKLANAPRVKSIDELYH